MNTSAAHSKESAAETAPKIPEDTFHSSRIAAMHSRHSTFILTRSIALLLVAGATDSVFAADNTWIGGTSSDYLNPANWSLNRVPIQAGFGDNVDIRTTPANIATLSGNAPQVVDIRVGQSNLTGTVGTFFHTAGSLSSGSGNWTTIGAGNNGAGSFAQGFYNLTGTAAGGGLTGFAQGSGTLNANSRLNVGGTGDGNYGVGGTGVLNVNTTGAVNVTEQIRVGVRQGTGTINLQSGTIQANQTIILGEGGTGNANVAGGTFQTSSELWVGNTAGSTGNLTVTGGTVNSGSWLSVGRDGGTGTFTMNGSAVVNQGASDGNSRFEIGNFGQPGSGTVNLDGGTLTTNGFIDQGGATFVSNIYFNGTLVKPRFDNTSFMANNFTSATVKTGGARFDTDGKNITIAQPFVGTTGDGGLTKSGAGTLVLSSTSTYNGATTVNGGTLQLNVGTTTGTLGGNGAVVINNGGTISSGTVDSLGFYNKTAGNTLTINAGGTLTVLEGGRLSMDRILNSVGGTITSTGTNFDNGASYAFRGFGNGVPNSYNFTSSPGGVASTISATNIGIDFATFNVTQGGGAVDLNVTGNVIDKFGTGGLIKSGNGVMVLAHANNNYTGPTVVNDGTLRVSGSVSATSSVTVNSGGTLLLGSTADKINDSAAVILNSGSTLNTGGFNEGPAGGASGASAEMGALTFSANSTIDFTSGTGSNLLFAGLNYTPGNTVSILRWTGLAAGDNGSASNDRLLFSISTGFTDAQLASFQFYDDAGSSFGSGATQIAFNGYFELVPLTAVPEPATWLAGSMLVGLLACYRDRRGRDRSQGDV